ncbi:MAG: hypothetical protein M3N24_01500 [Actinomycetota bacterium]|nr:hypothetical protein [Actinomycetota bacterium]
MLLVHPPEELTGLGLLPVGLSLLGGLAVVGVGGLLPGRRAGIQQERAVEVSPRTTREGLGLLRLWRSGGPFESWVGGLSRPQVATRAFAVVVLFFAIAAARVGRDFQLENIAPALVIGLAWPLLLLGSAILGPIWRWLDPWDAVARAVETENGAETPGEDEAKGPNHSVWPAVLPALAWAWYLNAYSGSMDPRPLGAALAAYSLFMVAACVAFGRQLWLSRTEVFGLLFGWTARLPRGQLVSWLPPAGAEALIGVLAGGFIFGRIRVTAWWAELGGGPLFALYSAAGVFVCAALGGALLWFLARRSAQVGAVGAAAAASVPALVSIALAVSMASSRLFNSLQLLPLLAGDPFGLGWDLLGTADWIVSTEPLGHVGLKVVQMIVLLIGHVVGAIVLSRRVQQPARAPALAALALLFVPTLIAVAGTP